MNHPVDNRVLGSGCVKKNELLDFLTYMLNALSLNTNSNRIYLRQLKLVLGGAQNHGYERDHAGQRGYRDSSQVFRKGDGVTMLEKDQH